MEIGRFTDSRTGKEIGELLKDQDRRLLVLWAADCAERALPSFEKQYPGDVRPRQAIEAGRAWVRGIVPMGEARKAAFAAHTAARDAGHASAGAAARAAGHAAAAAHVAGHAAHAATYAAKSAAFAAEPAEAAKRTEAERRWQRQRLMELKLVSDGASKTNKLKI